MKKIYKYTLGLPIGLLLLSLTFTSCSEDTMDGINKNNNYPRDVDARFILTDLIVSSAFKVVGADFSLYSSVYMEHEVGCHGQMYNAEIRQTEPTSSTTYNNSWVSAYENIKNAKLIIKKTQEEGGRDFNNKFTEGVARIFLAYNGAILTDLFGDVPYSQAGIIDADGLPVYRQPVVDKQEDIYKDILSQLDQAIALLPQGDNGTAGVVGAQDILYAGSDKAWLKVAYGLKARYTMRLLAKSADETEDLNSILEYIGKSFSSASEEFKFDKYDGGAQTNPLGAFSSNRAALATSESFINKLDERNDPRLLSSALSFSTGALVADKTKFFPAPNGTASQRQFEYDCWFTDYSFVGVTYLMSYSELMFLKAEAYARLTGQNDKAEEALKLAIESSLANFEKSGTGFYSVFTGKVSDLEIDVVSKFATYFTDKVKPLFDANPLQEVMIQKYLAFMGASGESIEAYNDYRRMRALGENFVVLENPKNAEGKFPLRFVYGNSDKLANPNVGNLVGDGTYVYTENVWWAGGTR